jgi:hypothetical protein
MKIIPKSIKARLKQMREPILEQMAIEQAFQANLRKTMVTSEDEKEVSKAKLLFDESVKHWEVLKHSLEEYGKLAEKKWKISPDTLLVVGANLLGIVLILKQEKIDIISSKALNFVLKGRV